MSLPFSPRLLWCWESPCPFFSPPFPCLHLLSPLERYYSYCLFPSSVHRPPFLSLGGAGTGEGRTRRLADTKLTRQGPPPWLCDDYDAYSATTTSSSRAPTLLDSVITTGRAD